MGTILVVAEIQKGKVREASLNLEWTKVTAPISGMTSKETRSEGSLVTTGSDGSLLTMNASGSHVTYDKGVVQTAMYDMLNCQKDLAAQLPFLNKERIQNW